MTREIHRVAEESKSQHALVHSTPFSVFSSSVSSSSFLHLSSRRHLDLLVRPKGWQLESKLVLNARTYSSGCGARSSLASISPLAVYVNTPHELVARLLSMAFRLYESVPRALGGDAAEEEIETDMSDAVQALWIDFMNGAALLQAVDLVRPDSNETLCLLLNLYHCMLLHAYLVVSYYGAARLSSCYPSMYNFN